MRISSPLGTSKNCKLESLVAETFVSSTILFSSAAIDSEECWAPPSPAESLQIKANSFRN